MEQASKIYLIDDLSNTKDVLHKVLQSRMLDPYVLARAAFFAYITGDTALTIKNIGPTKDRVRVTLTRQDYWWISGLVTSQINQLAVLDKKNEPTKNEDDTQSST